MESFFASLKRELVHRVHFSTQREAKSAVFCWIEVWYNRKRRHSSLGYVSPEVFEQKYQQQQQARVA
jgi:putative transposase